jgi:hypothetical protein
MKASRSDCAATAGAAGDRKRKTPTSSAAAATERVDRADDVDDRELSGLGGDHDETGYFTLLHLVGHIDVVAPLPAGHVDDPRPVGSAQLRSQRFDVGFRVLAFVLELVASHINSLEIADQALDLFLIGVVRRKELARQLQQSAVHGDVDRLDRPGGEPFDVHRNFHVLRAGSARAGRQHRQCD